MLGLVDDVRKKIQLKIHLYLQQAPWFALLIKRGFVKEQKHKGEKFIEFCKDLEIDESCILYESFFGVKISDSPYAIFRGLVENEKYSHLTHIWVRKTPAHIPQDVLNSNSTKIVEIGSDEYVKYLATAKYLVNNSSFPPFYIRRDGQIYINTWHGVPFKTMFKEEKVIVGAYANTQRNFLQTTHFVSPNSYTTAKLLEGSDVDRLFTGAVSECGLPRSDLMTSADVPALKSRVGAGLGGKKILLYAPTWRRRSDDISSVAKDLNMIEITYGALGEKLTEQFDIFVSFHNFQESDEANSSVRAIPDGIEINEFLAIVDVLVTDFSSIMFDFIPTKKPLYLFQYDLDEYDELRGVYFDSKHIPAVRAFEIHQLISQLKNDAYSRREFPNQNEFIKKYCPPIDGTSTKNVIEFVFGNNNKLKQSAKNEKRNILIYPGDLSNKSIANCAINISNEINENEFDVYFINEINLISKNLNKYNLKKYEINLERLSKISENIKIIHYTGEKYFLHEGTKTDLTKLLMSRGGQADSGLQVFRRLFEREFRRNFGDARFDVAIDFGGSEPFWTFLIGCSRANRKLVFQHCEPEDEREGTVRALGGVSALYHLFDFVACRSQAMRDVNYSNFGKYVGHNSDKFIVVSDVRDIESIADQSDS